MRERYLDRKKRVAHLAWALSILVFLIGVSLSMFSLMQGSPAFFSYNPPKVANIQSSVVSLIDEEEKPRPALLALFKLTGIALDEKDGLDDIVVKTQEHWFGKGKERWQLEAFHDKSKAGKILECLDQLNLMQPVSAKHSGEDKAYDYVFVHGALASRIESRLNFLTAEYQRGVRFKELVFLSGARDLDEEKEKTFIDQGLKTEAELFSHIWRKITHDMPALAQQGYILIDAPKKEIMDRTTGQKKFIRPGTEDTIQLWLNTQKISLETPIKVLAISNQHYVHYQDLIVKRCLKKYCMDKNLKSENFILETIGEGAQISEGDKGQYIANHLDNLARCLYEIKKLKELSLTPTNTQQPMLKRA